MTLASVETTIVQFRLWMFFALIWLMSGCAEPRPDAVRFGVRHLGLADPSIAFEGCTLALEAEGFVIDERDLFKGTLKTFPRPVALEDRGASAAATLIEREARETATMHVVAHEHGHVTIYSQVKVERQTTETQRLRAAEMSGTDVPASTPIDREAATTDEQNAVWTDHGRNREVEQGLLERAHRFVKELSVGES